MWSVWVCSRCRLETELNDNSPLEAWCARCRRSLEAVADDEDVDE
jgi:hypothetical protein